MSWPIPDIPNEKTIAKPKFWLWIILLMFMLIVGAIFSVWFLKVETYAKIFLYGVLPAIFFWLCIFGVILNRYEQSLVACRAWLLETERTKDEWCLWSRQQLAVIGNVLFSPEERGMAALLGELDTVPAYPKKARPLFNSPHNFPEVMKEIDRKLECQYPDYRFLLHSIYVLQSLEGDNESCHKAIYQQWDLMPTSIYDFESIVSVDDSEKFQGLVLILCIQDWVAGSVGQSSEFISAQLITSPLFARQHSLPVIAGITRMMPLEAGQLMSELDMLFEYIQPDKKNLEYVWLLDAAEKTAEIIMQYATGHQWPLPEKRPLHSIDLSFGPPGEMALPLSLAMLAEAANQTGKDQLLVNHTPQQTGMLCLITRELYA